MIINKVMKSCKLGNLNLPKEYLDNLSANLPGDVLDVLAKVISTMLRKQDVSENEIQDFVSKIKERRMSDLFEGCEGFCIREEKKMVEKEAIKKSYNHR